MAFNLPARHNEKLRALVARVNQDQELQQWWRSANINAVDRSGISDHGEVHIQIVANSALKMLRMLVGAGVEPSIVSHYQMTREDAEVVVVLASLLHDLGIAIHRDNHEQYSLIVARPKAVELLTGIYEQPGLTIMLAETLHAIIAHRWDVRCLTIEAGVLKVADALDMSEGRSRIPFEAGKVNIHSVSAAAVDEVHLVKGEHKPIRIEVLMSNSAGIFQLDELLRRKLQSSSIVPYVEVSAHITGETERRIIPIYEL